MTKSEIQKIVNEGLAAERDKLYDETHLLRLNPKLSKDHDHHPCAPWYPEMNQEGYNHKIHGNAVIPDYRVYQIGRTAQFRPELQAHLKKLELDGLKDPWMRNELWKWDPHGGYDTKWNQARTYFGMGMKWGAILAVSHFVLRKVYDHVYPPHEHVTDKWWELRETPEPNIISNRIKPRQYYAGLIPLSTNPKLMRAEYEDFGVVQPPPMEWYDKDKDPLYEPPLDNLLRPDTRAGRRDEMNFEKHS